jgi:DNA-binding MarR family transcriptional regulator
LLIAVTDKGRALLAEDLCARQVWLERAMAANLSAKERKALTTAAQAMMKLAVSRVA